MNLRSNGTRTVAGWGLVLGSVVSFWLIRSEPARADGAASRGKEAVPSPQAQSLTPGLPFRFEINRGQLADDVEFLARGQGYGLYLTRDSATLRLLRGQRGAELDPATLTLRLVGATAVKPRGVNVLPGHSSYFVGNDSSRWRSGVESYTRVRYDQLLPGVSMVYYGTDGQALEYDLELDAGVDPQGIELAFEGAEAMHVAADGAAVLRLVGGGEVRQSPPVSYQLDGAGRRVQVASRYEQRGGLRLGFSVGAYDTTRPLVIDPAVAYATYLGGDGFEDTYGVAVDAIGNVYVVGQTTSTIFSTSAPYQVHLSGFSDAFVSKINPGGTAFVYSTFLGGSGSEFGYGVAADAAGNAYVAGLTTSANFPTAGALQPAYGGGSQDGFVTKLTPNGSALTYSTYLGGAGDDYVGGISLDTSNDAFLIGTTSSGNFPVLGAFQPLLAGVNDAFVAKLNALGSALSYSTYLGGSSNESGASIRVNGAGEAFVTGATSSLNFPTASAFQPARAGTSGFDAFVTRLGASGSSVIYSTYLGGASTDRGASIAIDAASNAYVTGDTNSIAFPTAAAYQAALAGSTDAFVSKLNSAGSSLVYSTYLGGSAADVGLGIRLDAGNSALVVGSTASSANFPLLAPTQNVYGGGTSDGFVAKLTPAGAALGFSTYVGGSAPDRATAITTDVAGNAYVVGNTQSTNLPLTSAFRPTFAGVQDTFLMKLTFTHPAPAGGLWTVVCLGGFLLGLGLIAAGFGRRRRHFVDEASLAR